MYSSNFQTPKNKYTNSCTLYWNNCMKSVKQWFDKTFDCLKPPHKRLNPILSYDLNNYLFADGNQSTATTSTGKGKKYKIHDGHIVLDTNSHSDSEDLGMYQPPRPEIIVTESYESINSSDDDSSDDLELSNSSIRQLTTGDSLEVSNDRRVL